VFFWHEQAAALGVNTPAHGLDLPSIQTRLEQLCARVTLISSNLPAQFAQGAQFDLELVFGLDYNNGVREPTDFQVVLDASAIVIQQPNGLTGLGDAGSPLGMYRTVITESSSGGPISINAEACLVLTERIPPQPDPAPRFTSVCMARCIVGGSPTGGPQPTFGAALATAGVTSDDDTCEELYFNDFTTGPVGSEWSRQLASTSPAGQRFLGDFGPENVTLNLDSLPPHSALILEFDVYVIGSWNGNGCSTCNINDSATQPDIVFVEVSSPSAASRILQTTFSNLPRDRQAYPGPFPGAANQAGAGALAVGALGYPPGTDPSGGNHFGDIGYRIRLSFPHTEDLVTLVFGSQQSSGQNERWGIDNVRLRRLP
jgi:hypothetical protein